jgi:hypothetical protein
MWNNIARLLSLIFTVSDRLERHDKKIDTLERQNIELTKQVQYLAFQLDHQSERENWREETLRQAQENEKLRLNIQQLSEPKERPALPPAPRVKKPKKA